MKKYICIIAVLAVLSLACTAEVVLAPVDFCFIFDCSGGGWFDPCSADLFADCAP